jgi:hypothetical protein
VEATPEEIARDETEADALLAREARRASGYRYSVSTDH